MFEAGDIREWRGYDVVDPEGHKIGELEAVYVDTSTDLPAFGTVKVGIPTRHRRRAASGRRRGRLQALRPDLSARHQRRTATGPPLTGTTERSIRCLPSSSSS